MGQAARKLDTAVRGAGRVRDTHLRLVRPTPVRRQSPQGMSEAACRSLFRLTLVVLAALALFGLARVGLSAKVAEASIDATRLRKTIKDETLVADRLELDKSRLVLPSRIESIAAGSLEMTAAAPARYLPLAEAGASAGASATASPATPPPAGAAAAGRVAFGTLMGAALDVTQKEARTLLVGDAGLSNTP
jgi:hypothetical protein